jgi:hypothetical protein
LIIRAVTLLMGLCLLSGCVTDVVYGPCYGKTLPQLLDSTNLKPLFQEMAYELCSDHCTDCAAKNPDGTLLVTPQPCGLEEIRRQTVLVTDFVDIRSYMPEISGLLMGEMMRGSLNQVCCYKIVQAEFGKYFKLNENGLISLTRRVSEIKKDDYPQPEAVVGTYNYLNNGKVVLFVRRINTTTGYVVKMVTREIDYSCLGRQIRYGVR